MEVTTHQYTTVGSDDIKQIIATDDGNFLLVGEINSSTSGGYDMWVDKRSSTLSPIWQTYTTFGGSKNDGARRVVETSDGFVILGNSESDKSGDKSENSRGLHDFWVVKIDKNGKKVWDKTLGGNQREGESDLLATSDGGFLLLGGSPSDKSGDKSENSKGKSDYWLVKLNSRGES